MKNSAGITFNENTDLIIEAEPTGEVTSCRNIINGVEYVGGGGGSNDLSTAEVTVNITGGDGAIFSLAYLLEEGDMKAVFANIQGSGIYNVIIAGIGSFGLLYSTNWKIDEVTGNIEKQDDSAVIVSGSGTINIIRA